MLKVTIPGKEYFNEETLEFSYSKEYEITLKHSLVSISKWESKWKKAFLGKSEKTDEELIDYIRCMTITQNIPHNAYYNLGINELNDITEYIEDSKTATYIPPSSGGNSREVMTSELIYYYMSMYQIPWEAQRWHLNRLLTLINVFSIKNSNGKKMSKSEILERNRRLNEARRRKHNLKG